MHEQHPGPHGIGAGQRLRFAAKQRIIRQARVQQPVLIGPGAKQQGGLEEGVDLVRAMKASDIERAAIMGGQFAGLAPQGGAGLAGKLRHIGIEAGPQIGIITREILPRPGQQAG